MSDAKHAVKIMEPEEDGDVWVISHYTLAQALDVGGGGYGAEETVSSALKKANPALAARISYDSEFGCFFAYAQSQQDAEELATFIDGLIVKDTDNSIESSPAFFTTKTE